MKKGISLVFLAAVISGLAVFFNKFGLEAVAKDSSQYTTLKNGLTALILSLLVFTPAIWRQAKELDKKDWLKLLLIGLIGGSVPFLLFFKGLSLTSSVSAAFIHKTLFVWIAILAWPLLKEKIRGLQFAALAVLFLGLMVFDGFKELKFGWAEMMIFSATLMWAAENVIAKVVLRKMDSIMVAWGRMFFGSLILAGFLLLTGNTAGLFNLDSGQMGWLFLVAALLTGYVIAWYGALKRLPVTVVACVLTLAFPITALLNGIFVAHKLPLEKITASLIIALGACLFWQIGEMKEAASIKTAEHEKLF